MTPCAVCGSSISPKYDKGSTWCVVCVERMLDEQRQLDTPVQERQYIG